tara:strand:- start:382 stop:921 length:540 start_codon:yes stop_codon:yes gene_type:complete
MNSLKLFKTGLFFIIPLLLLNACNGKLPGGDARKFPDDPAKRVEQNLKEGRGFRLNDMVKNQGGVFDFASSNELWRASLDAIDFIPLASANYSGGIIITDWYSNDIGSNESIKITIRFLTNEIRSDAIDIKIYSKKCSNNLINCEIIETKGILVAELRKKILKNASLLKKEKEETNNKK